MGTKVKDLLAQQLKDPEFRQEYNRLQPWGAALDVMLAARKDEGLTQKQLAERSGIDQAEISRIETGEANPTVKTLQRLAEAMGMRLVVSFEKLSKGDGEVESEFVLSGGDSASPAEDAGNKNATRIPLVERTAV